MEKDNYIDKWTTTSPYSQNRLNLFKYTKSNNAEYLFSKCEQKKFNLDADELIIYICPYTIPYKSINLILYFIILSLYFIPGFLFYKINYLQNFQLWNFYQSNYFVFSVLIYLLFTIIQLLRFGSAKKYIILTNKKIIIKHFFKTSTISYINLIIKTGTLEGQSYKFEHILLSFNSNKFLHISARTPKTISHKQQNAIYILKTISYIANLHSKKFYISTLKYPNTNLETQTYTKSALVFSYLFGRYTKSAISDGIYIKFTKGQNLSNAVKKYKNNTKFKTDATNSIFFSNNNIIGININNICRKKRTKIFVAKNCTYIYRTDFIYRYRAKDISIFETSDSISLYIIKKSCKPLCISIIDKKSSTIPLADIFEIIYNKKNTLYFTKYKYYWKS